MFQTPEQVTEQQYALTTGEDTSLATVELRDVEEGIR